MEERLTTLRKDIQQETDKRIDDLQQEINLHKTQIEASKKQTEVLKKDAEEKQQLIEEFKITSESLKKEVD